MSLDEINERLSRLEFDIEEGVWGIAEAEVFAIDKHTESVISDVRKYAALIQLKKEQYPDEE